MRRVVFHVCCLLALVGVARAQQITLTPGTYTETFNGIGAGLPSGWSVFTSSSANSHGTASTFAQAASLWNATLVGTDFRNIASNDIAVGSVAGTQNADTNRALGWRPLSSASRNGAVVATFANTTGLGVTTLSVTLFTANEVASSDQTYQFEYRVGDTGNFIQIGSTYTTGLPLFNTATLTADATTLIALSNQTGPVYVRIRGTSSSGSGNLDTLGIDNFVISTKTAQTITFGALSNKTVLDTPFNVSTTATANSGLTPITFSIVSGNATATGTNGATITITGLGIVTVRAAQAGDSTYAAAPAVDQSFTVTKAPQTISFGALATKTFGNAPFTVSATADSSLTPTFSIVSGPATTSDNTATLTGAGTVIVRASQAGNATYAAAADVDQSFTVNKANQTITFGSLLGKPFGAAPFSVSATTDSGLSPTFSVFSGPATISGGTVTLTGAGTVVVRAAQGGSSDYNAAATVDQSFSVAQAPQTITFNALADRVTSDPPFTVSATASSGLPVNFSIASGPASISGSTITLSGSTGTVTVRASQAGSANYLAAADVDRSFIVALPSVTINTQPVPQTVTAFQSATFSVSASVGSGTLSYQWRKSGSTITGIASANTATLTLTNVVADDAGSYDVVVTGPGGSVTSFPATLTVNKAAATVTLGSLSATFDGATHAATATTSPANLAIGFTYNGSSSAPSAGGSYTVVGTIADANYSGTAAGTLAIGKASQTITFPEPVGTLRATVPFTASATASSGLTPITFSIVSGNATATGTNGATITVPDTNPFVVRATQIGNGNYSAAATDLALTVSTAPATPGFAVQPTAATSYTVGDVVTLSPTVTGVPEPTYQWRKDGVAISGNASASTATLVLNSVALTDAGNYDLVATNGSGSATSNAVGFTVTKKSQTITFDTPATAVSAGTGVPLTATASSGLTVSYTIVSGAGSIAGSTLTSLGSNVVVRASQAGNATTFSAAANVDRTFTFVVGGSAPFIFSPPLDQTVNAGATVTFSAAAIGTPAPTWQWQKDGAAISGATSATLTLTNVTLTDAARYTAVATNGAGSVSASAVLTVHAAPAFSVSPASQSTTAGANITFTASVSGSPMPTLQWRKNGIAIPGAISNTLTLVNVRTADAARYDVVATSTLGSAMSDAATLTVSTRNFSGIYFGKFAGAAGDFALYVRTDGTAVFLGFLPGSNIGFASTNVIVDLAGNFSLTFATLSAAGSSQPFEAVSDPRSGLSVGPNDSEFTGRAGQAITLSGTLNDSTGMLTATVPELSLTLDGTRASTTGVSATQAGFYTGAFVGSADGRGYVIVGADGQAFALSASSTVVDGAKGTVGTNGHVTITTSNQSTLDLGFTNGALSGTVRSATGTISTLDGATDALAGTERLANLSARGGVTRGAPLIAGFVVTGTAAKQVLIRAAGPALAAAPFNLAGTLDDPALQLFRGNTVIAQNDNWSTPTANATAITTAANSVNAFTFRSGSADAALLTTLSPGAYTVQVAGSVTSLDGAGTALVEIYEILAPGEAPGTRRLANLSARGPVTPGAPLIAGFVINGTAPQRVLIRGIGPGLSAFGVSGTLANPSLTLFRGSATFKTNDDWFRDSDAILIRDAAAKSGAFALGASSLDASMLLFLSPGAYTAQVSASGTTNGTGNALVEIYEVSP